MAILKFERQYGSKNIESVEITKDESGGTKTARIKIKDGPIEEFFELDKVILMGIKREKMLKREKIGEVSSGLLEKVRMIAVTTDKYDNTKMNIFLGQ